MPPRAEIRRTGLPEESQYWSISGGMYDRKNVAVGRGRGHAPLRRTGLGAAGIRARRGRFQLGEFRGIRRRARSLRRDHRDHRPLDRRGCAAFNSVDRLFRGGDRRHRQLFGLRFLRTGHRHFGPGRFAAQHRRLPAAGPCRRHGFARFPVAARRGHRRLGARELCGGRFLGRSRHLCRPGRRGGALRLLLQGRCEVARLVLARPVRRGRLRHPRDPGGAQGAHPADRR
jgi:hypothetical protein